MRRWRASPREPAARPGPAASTDPRSSPASAAGPTRAAGLIRALGPTPARASALLRACHPEPTAAVTLFATALALACGQTVWGGAAVAAAVLTGQLSVGWSNDAIDRDRDARGGRADKPIAVGAVGAGAVAVASGLALLACVPLSFASGMAAGWVHLMAVASAWAYNLGLKATPLSVAPYLVSFALLPTFVVLGLPDQRWPPWWLPLAAALLGAGAHFANVLPDLAVDARTGVRGLPQRLGATGARLSAAVLLVGGSAVAVLGPGGPVPTRVGILALVAVLALLMLRLGDRHAFRLAMAIAAINVALVIAAGTRLN
ncbi:MAG: UbiA family prenyltransferase [Frankia sp.]|nr:UbiA family prenyltransferase [Frankia sp.]